MSRPTIHVRKGYRGEGVVLHNSHSRNEIASLAISLVHHYGLIAAHPDGEDSSGRAKLRLLTPEEAVERSYEIADKMIRRLCETGDLIELPAPPMDEDKILERKF